MCAIGRIHHRASTAFPAAGTSGGPTRPHTLSQLHSSIIFVIRAVKLGIMKVAYTRLNFAERGFIPRGRKSFWDRLSCCRFPRFMAESQFRAGTMSEFSISCRCEDGGRRQRGHYWTGSAHQLTRLRHRANPLGRRQRGRGTCPRRRVKPQGRRATVRASPPNPGSCSFSTPIPSHAAGRMNKHLNSPHRSDRNRANASSSDPRIVPAEAMTGTRQNA